MGRMRQSRREKRVGEGEGGIEISVRRKNQVQKNKYTWYFVQNRG